MKPHFAPSSILLAAACACQVAAGQFANGQATSGGQPALAATADSSQTPNQKWPLVLNIARYANFFGWLGAEDGRIQRQTREGRQQIAPRIDYSSAIAIRSDEEEAMLALVLDADRRRAENEKKWKEADDAFIIAQQRGTDQELGLTRPDHQAVLNANWAILMGTWIKLKQLLGDEDFKKLDDYVNREFATTRYPASVYPPKIEVRAPVATIDKYELLIDHVTYEDRRVQRAVQAGNELQTHRENYSLAARFPQNEEEPTLAILRDARLRLNEKDEQIKAIGQEFAQKYGPRYSFKKPYPPYIEAWDQQIQAIARERKTVIEETKDKLRRVLGEESFNRLDAWLTRRYEPKATTEYSPDGEPNPRIIIESPAAPPPQP